MSGARWGAGEMVLAGRVLCVMMASASGHIILERFYDPISEPDQMRWRDRLHRAEASSGAGASTVGESDCDKLATRCGVARHGDENMVWCGVGDLRFYAVGSGEYDEYTRESSPPPPSVRVGAHSFPLFSTIPRPALTRIPSRFPYA